MVKQLLLSLSTLCLAAGSYAADICSNYCNGTTKLNWKPCQVKEFPGIECAEFQVPIDWDDCASDPITLTVNRLPSTSSKKIGSFFMRLGGPGIYTSYGLFETVARQTATIPDEIKSNFDVLVLDNRGTGFNYPVKCDYDLWNADRVEFFPQMREGYERTVEAYRVAGQSCVEKTGPVIHHMDALTHAKDLEALRVILDEPLSIYALSWGSQAISQYAETFPDNIRAMILDGNVPHFLSKVDMGLSGAMNIALTSQRVLGWASTNDSSPLYGQDTMQLWRDLIKQVEEKPIHKPNCEDPKQVCRTSVTAQDLRGSLEAWSETPSAEGFIAVAESMSELLKGNATAFSTDNWTEERAKESDPTGQSWTQAAIGCQDQLPDLSWEAYQSWAQITTTQAIPANAGYLGNIQLFCPKWPTKVKNPPNLQSPNVNTSATIMVVNALWDPATGYDQAVAMHRHFPNSVLVARNGEGHGSWSAAWPETLKTMIDYLVDLKLPEPNLVLDEPMGTFDVFIKDADQ